MIQSVESILPGTTFAPSDADPAFVWIAARGAAVLALAPHFDDADQRHVVLRWSGVADARLGSPNDEARHLHPDLGALATSAAWIGEVHGSAWIESRRPLVHPRSLEGRRHFIVLDEESTYEVIARDLRVVRLAGPSLDAAFEACDL